MNRHRILTKPKLSKAGSFTREFYHFHLSFVCFIYYREMFLSSCFLLQLCCHCFVIVTGFNFPPSSRLCFTSFYWLLLHPSPQPLQPALGIVYTSHFILQTSTQIYFNPQTRYTKVISLLLLLLVLRERYLNFILMFVPSINFYNPFINLIKTIVFWLPLFRILFPPFSFIPQPICETIFRAEFL